MHHQGHEGHHQHHGGGQLVDQKTDRHLERPALKPRVQIRVQHVLAAGRLARQQ